jgi:RND family efflux transporter MFP subunit
MNRTGLRSILLTTLASAVLLAACGGKPGDAASAAKAGDGAAAPAASALASGDYAAIASGKVDIEGGLVDIAARVPGIVEAVLVQEGDMVKAGQVLAKQEDTDARLSRDRAAAQLKQAQAQIPIIEVQLAGARRELDRIEKLRGEGAVSQQAFDQASDTARQLEAQLGAQRASVALQKAQLAEANFQVEQYTVRAPADGLIVRRYANPGMGASTLQVTPMFQLQPDARRIVRAEVEERSLPQVQVGQAAEIVPEAEQSKAYPARVIRIAGVMGARKLKSDDPSQRTDERVIEVVVDAEQAPVLVGQRVFVRFLKGQPQALAN